MNQLTGFYALIVACFLYSCSGSITEKNNQTTDSLTADSLVVPGKEQQRPQPVTDIVPEYKTYEGNSFIVNYPANIMALNQDSSAFVTGDGTAIIELEGKHYFLGDETDPTDLETHYKNLLASTTAKIVYKAKGNNYCVVSGTEGGEIFYIKSVYFYLLKPDENNPNASLLVRSDLVTMKFTYPESDKDYYNPIVAMVSKSFQFQP